MDDETCGETCGVPCDVLDLDETWGVLARDRDLLDDETCGVPCGVPWGVLDLDETWGVLEARDVFLEVLGLDFDDSACLAGVDCELCFAMRRLTNSFVDNRLTLSSICLMDAGTGLGLIVDMVLPLVCVRATVGAVTREGRAGTWYRLLVRR